MAARKKRAGGAAPGNGNGHAFAVVVEQLQDQFRAFGESLQDVKDGFARLEQRFDGLEQRFDGLEQRFDGVEGRLGRVEAAVLEHTRELKDFRVALDRKVDREELPALLQELSR